MKEYVLVEFLASFGEGGILQAKLGALGDDFVMIKDDYEYDVEDDSGLNWIRVSGKISSMYASVIKLQDPFLAERMRISYIPEDLKDKYRT